MRNVSIAVALTVTIGGASTVQAQAAYKRDIPDSLAARAKIDEPAAAAIAQKRFRTGTIQAVELEQENGKLIYSYELKVAGRKGVEEVNVNAMTGKIVAVEHESAAAEKAEAEAEKVTGRASKPKKP